VARWRLVLATNAVLLSGAFPAAAHGLGERYDLPLPLNLYVFAAALVVALTFIAMLLFGRSGAAVTEVRLVPPRGWTLPAWRGGIHVEAAVRWMSASLFIVLVLAGLIGSRDPFKNPLPVSVWVLGWVGIAYVCALLGNVWAVINPWDNLFRAAQWLAGRWGRAGLHAPPMRYPAALGGWPAVALFLIFAWMELVWPAKDHPPALALAILAYSAVTWGGMALFGRRTWLDKGEFLSVAFSLLARFAVIGGEERATGERLVLRPPAVGLLVRQPASPSLSAFVLLMLATVTFDGLLETPLWAALRDWAVALPAVQQAGELLGVRPDVLVASTALLVFPLIFGSIYLAVIRVMAAASGEGSASSLSGLSGLFVFSLLPIAIGYHLAHYFSYLLIAGQFIIPIASDPFGLGWNLFGTKLYLIDFSVVNAQLVWYACLVLIVGGHVIAIWLAHIQAERHFASPRLLLGTQAPMAALMVGYTALSLWILAQPIVEAPS
jgi:hypothetical protein